MKIVLVEVTPEKSVVTMEPVPPLGLGYIASALESKGFKVSIIDGIKYQYSIDEAYRLIVAENPDVVGYTATTSARFRAINLIKRVKKATNALSIVGGPHFHPTAREALEKVSEIDVVVRGEGEVTTAEVLDKYAKKMEFTDIQGVSFRNFAGKIIENPDALLISDLDNYAPPAYHLYSLPNYKCKLEGTNLPAIGVISSRGCPNRCNFCANTALKKGTLRLRNPIKFVDEIEFLKKEYNYRAFDFWDDTLTMIRPHINLICNEILKRNLDIKWFARARVNTVDANLLNLMKKAGCIAIAYGIESGSEKVLKNIKKGITTAQAREAVKISSEVGLIVSNYFIVSMPGETTSDIDLTFDMINDFNKFTNVNNYYCFAMVYPGTELEQIARVDQLTNFSWYQPYQSIKNLSVGNDPTIPCFEQNELSIESIKCHILKKKGFISKINKLGKKLVKIKSINELKELLAFICKYFLK